MRDYHHVSNHCVLFMTTFLNEILRGVKNYTRNENKLVMLILISNSGHSNIFFGEMPCTMDQCNTRFGNLVGKSLSIIHQQFFLWGSLPYISASFPSRIACGEKYQKKFQKIFIKRNKNKFRLKKLTRSSEFMKWI